MTKFSEPKPRLSRSRRVAFMAAAVGVLSMLLVALTHWPNSEEWRLSGRWYVVQPGVEGVREFAYGAAGRMSEPGDPILPPSTIVRWSAGDGRLAMRVWRLRDWPDVRRLASGSPTWEYDWSVQWVSGDAAILRTVTEGVAPVYLFRSRSSAVAKYDEFKAAADAAPPPSRRAADGTGP